MRIEIRTDRAKVRLAQGVVQTLSICAAAEALPVAEDESSNGHGGTASQETASGEQAD
jgi:hypothetical protein